MKARLRLFRLILLASLLAALAAPAAASAHEKWFVDGNRYPIQWERLFSLPTAAALLTAALALGGFLLLRRLLDDPRFPNPPWLRPVESSVQAVIGIQTAISLVYMTVKGSLLSPPLSVGTGPLGLALLGVQIFVSFTLVTGWLTRVGGALLIGLVACTFLLFPPVFAFEQVLFVGIGLFFLVMGRGLFRPAGERMRRLDAFWRQYTFLALPVLRVFTGLSILWLAFSEKLLAPEMGVAFLREYPNFNFMRLLGFSWFTDELFVYSAAAVEATVGVLLIAGVLPRLVILFMWLPFNVTIPLLPPDELLGHLPILAVMYAVFLEGPGRLQPAEAEGEPVAMGQGMLPAGPKPAAG
jgi:hypothetical protein